MINYMNHIVGKISDFKDKILVMNKLYFGKRKCAQIYSNNFRPTFVNNILYRRALGLHSLQA